VLADILGANRESLPARVRESSGYHPRGPYKFEETMSNKKHVWRYFIVAGALAGAVGAGQIYSGHFGCSIGVEVVALALVLYGLLSHLAGRRQRTQWPEVTQ
jgi:hypothetical protein